MAGSVDTALERELLDFRTVPGLDPVLRNVLIGAAAQGLPKLSDVEPAMARAYFEQVCAQLNATQNVPGETQDLTVAGLGGTIRARLYRQAEQSADTGLILFFHGGGWVLGSIETHDPLCRTLSLETGWPVLSVDYRLAPEHPFPAAIEDARSALAWVRAQADALSIDADRIIVAGDSAGANIAAALTLDDRGGAGSRICGQLLIYPAIAHEFDSASMQRCASGFGLERGDMEWFASQYQSADTDPRDPMHSPLYADTLAHLPPAVVVTAGFDPLRDEGMEYADCLQAAGNQVEFRNFATLNHGFLTLVGIVPAAKTAMHEIMELAKGLCRPTADQVADANSSHQRSNQ
jgi:acetyl esterase